MTEQATDTRKRAQREADRSQSGKSSATPGMERDEINDESSDIYRSESESIVAMTT
jgi:hypothetical protein